jgi:dTDP-4-amino-4,6-dideoxygalactose transaminase
LIFALHEHEIYPGVHYRDNTEYRMYQYGAGTCPRAHEASRSILSLPLHLGLTRPDIERITQLVDRYAR